MDKNDYFIEETTDNGYSILWRGTDADEAVKQLKELKTPNRIELWTKSHVETTKGFAPLAYRRENESTVSLSHTFIFLHLDLTNGDVPDGLVKIQQK